MFFFALGAVLGFQRLIETDYRRRKIEKLLYLPTGKFIKPAVLGYDDFAADYFWLKTIGYFGGHYMADHKYPWLAHILNLVTDLDPRYSIAYYFGGVVLAVEANDVAASTALLKKGMRNLPDRWKYPFFIGFNSFYYEADLATAAVYIEKAATLPGHPEYLPKLAASLYARAGKVEAAIEFLERVYDSLEDERLRSNILAKINDLKAGRLPVGLEKILKDKEG